MCSKKNLIFDILKHLKNRVETLEHQNIQLLHMLNRIDDEFIEIHKKLYDLEPFRFMSRKNGEKKT